MIAALANEKQKNTEGLESLDYQFNKFTDLFINLDADEIQNTLLAIAKTKSPEQLLDYFDQGVNSLINTIDAGDSQTLASQIDHWCDEDPADYESLLFERNRNWIPKIEQLLNRKQDTLVVVGAGHLVGDQNVLQLLKQKGYRVRRFYNSFRLIEEE